MTDRNASEATRPEPDVIVTPSGGSPIAVVLVMVVILILAALSFMLFGIGSEAADPSEAPVTTVQ